MCYLILEIAVTKFLQSTKKLTRDRIQNQDTGKSESRNTVRKFCEIKDVVFRTCGWNVYESK
jgi:hypothetical protein